MQTCGREGFARLNRRLGHFRILTPPSRPKDRSADIFVSFGCCSNPQRRRPVLTGVAGLKSLALMTWRPGTAPKWHLLDFCRLPTPSVPQCLPHSAHLSPPYFRDAATPEMVTALSHETLMCRYEDTPMSLVDACLVRLSELHSDCQVFTLDADFRRYRRHGRQGISKLGLASAYFSVCRMRKGPRATWE
jgi:hypothetical protein